MSIDNSAIVSRGLPLSIGRVLASGIACGFVGVLAFSFTVPMTRIAIGGFDSVFVGIGRSVIAGVIAALALRATRATLPTAIQWLRLCVVIAGIVIGFPLFTSLALTSTTAGHSAVIVGLLPAVTASIAALRTKERARLRFWMFALAGAVSVVAYSLAAHGQLSAPGIGDFYLVCAVVLGACGYAEGGMLARELGAWQTVSWALVGALPITITVSAIALAKHPLHATGGQWAAFIYLAVISMYLGFFAWYRGLALGPMTTVSQTQLLQPVLTLVWSITLLGESASVTAVVGAAAIVLFAWCAVRSRPSPGSNTTSSTTPTAAPHHASDNVYRREPISVGQ